jgi:Lon protease-like protein
MSLNHVDLTLPENFDNVVRLFPLPNLVLFPGVIQALHIFESRYRDLMVDALASDGLITMALIEPNWKSQFLDEPSLFSTVCIGKIVTHARLDDGRYNLLLMGAHRAKIVRELDRDTAYRVAEVELCQEHPVGSPGQAGRLKEQVIQRFRNLAARRPQLDEESLEELLREDLPLGQLVDLISYSSGMSPVDQQNVLAETDICQRVEVMLEILSRQQEIGSDQVEQASNGFPPDFSLN